MGSYIESGSELTRSARNAAANLTYGDPLQGQAKHLLLEMAQKIDASEIRAHKKKDGILLINGSGRSRFATLKESILYRLFGVLPKTI